jgi:single-stranded-DNA-specific exonuclease
MSHPFNICQADPRVIRRIQKELSYHPVMATVLANRGFENSEDIHTFLYPAITDLTPPFSLKDIGLATERIGQALKRHEKILIFGDYDVDGITSTTILSNFLQYAGARVSTHIPHRIEDGYSLSATYIKDHAAPNGIDLIITVDNGSSCHTAVDQARAMNIDVIIVDHHTIFPPYPKALAVVNPKRTDCPSGLADLAGVGVAFSLLICLRKHLREIDFWKDLPEPNLKNECDLVALGTVADMVPLRHDNRILTRIGLDIIRRNRLRPGLKALMKIAGVCVDTINAEDIAFRLAPRINAAGRMAHAGTALSLFTDDDPTRISTLVQRIEALNSQRRKTQQKLFDHIQADLAANPDLLDGCSLVLWGKHWHEGVLGIVAAHLMREYHRPIVLISTRNGSGKGSARSIPGFDLYRGLDACSETLLNYGGHALAAGVKIRTDQLDEFRKQFEKTVRKVAEKRPFAPEIEIDSELNLNDISDQLLNELELLAPFGSANREPLFISRNIDVVSWKMVGQHHLNLRLRQHSDLPGRTFQAMHFNIDPEKPVPHTFDHIVFRVGWNRWNQTQTARIIIEAV